MDEIPLPFIVYRITLSETSTDALGNPVQTRVPEELACAWWVPSSEEKVAAGHPVTETRLHAFVAASDGWRAGHEAVIPTFDPQVTLTVEGDPLDYMHGPWAHEWPLDRAQITLKEVRG